jgi:hypothetical protein
MGAMSVNFTAPSAAMVLPSFSPPINNQPWTWTWWAGSKPAAMHIAGHQTQ